METESGITRGTGPFPAWQRYARQGRQSPAAELEHCRLCAQPIPAEHRHVLEVATQRIACACYPCSVLFQHDAASAGRYRLVPDRRLALVDFRMSDAQWESLRIPVGMAYFFRSTPAGRVMAFYPSPLGATESLLELEAWEALERDNPVLETMTPDVEALLVNRSNPGGASAESEARQCFLVPVDDCYRLVALLRTHWKGLSGGTEVWERIDEFFASLSDKAERSAR